MHSRKQSCRLVQTQLTSCYYPAASAIRFKKIGSLLAQAHLYTLSVKVDAMALTYERTFRVPPNVYSVSACWRSELG